jgi:hypothetical protein
MSKGDSKSAVRVTRQYNYGRSNASAKKRAIHFPELSPRWSGVFYFVAPLFVILLLIGGGLLAVWSYYAREQRLSEGPEARYPLFVLDAENVEADLLEKYISAQGGLKALTRLDHLTFRGSIFESGHQYVFEGMKERGGPGRCILTDRNSGIQLRFEEGRLLSDGITIPVNSGLLPMVSLVGELFDPFADLIMMRRGRILEVEEVDWRGIQAFRVRFDRPHLGMQTDIYLSGIDFSALERVDILPDGLKRSYRYSNYQYVNGFRFPFTIYVVGGGGQLKRIHFSWIDSDSSVVSDEVPVSHVAVNSNVDTGNTADFRPLDRN